MGIPAVVGLGAALLERIPDGAVAALNGFEGEIIIEPDEATRKELESRAAAEKAKLTLLEAAASEPARTMDGVQVEIGANIGEVELARDAVKYGADGVRAAADGVHVSEPIPAPG